MGLIKTLPICNLAQEEDLVTLRPPIMGVSSLYLDPVSAGFFFANRAPGRPRRTNFTQSRVPGSPASLAAALLTTPSVLSLSCAITESR